MSKQATPNPYTFWNLWTTPIWSAQDPEYNTRKDGLIEECMEYYNGQATSGVAGMIKSRMFESPLNLFDVAREKNYENLLYIEKEMETQFQTIFHDYFTNNHYPGTCDTDTLPDDSYVETSEAWVHVSTGPGSYHGDHNHPSTSWGGIYYIDVADAGGENGGINQFKQPYTNMYRDLGNFYQHNSHIFEIPPVNGTMVFFPANIMHNATPYFGDERRIVVASNMRLFTK